MECIGYSAFNGCTSLTNIVIPSTVNQIGGSAFDGCNNLVAIEFCEQIGQFLDEVPLPWWNNGASKVSLKTYSFLIQCNIPARLDGIKARMLKDNIHSMLQCIPTELLSRTYWEEDEDDSYFDDIESQLANYEYLQEVVLSLELALWKAKITERSNGNLINDDMKIVCRIDSLSMFRIIFPNVISFLFEE